MTESKQIPWLRIGTEGLAIVASILLAFAIDAWYENSVNRALGADYERRLTSELLQLKEQLQRENNNVVRSGEYAAEALAFLTGQESSVDPRRLVMALYNAGRDNMEPFVTATYADLVSTGRLVLIEDATVREAVLIAYAEIEEILEKWRSPYRNEYVMGVRSRVPQDIVIRIRQVCKEIQGDTWTCPVINIDENRVERIVQSVSTDEAVAILELRRQGLSVLGLAIDRSIGAVNAALVQLDRDE